MLKNTKKIFVSALSLALTVAMILPLCLFLNGCQEDKARETVYEPSENFVEGTLHKVLVTESDRVFVTNDGTNVYCEYKVVSGSGTLSKKAANFISSHITKATDAALGDVLDEDEVAYSTLGKYIYVNCTSQFEAAGLTMPTDDIGPTGYYIKTVGDSVFIQTKEEGGAQKGAISFLYHVLGYTMYAKDTVVYAKSGATLPDMDIIERPDYDFYVASNRLDDETNYGMGFQSTDDLFINVVSEDSAYNPWHNSLDFLPMKDYYMDEAGNYIHEKWYSDVAYTDADGKVRRELCYTAHGDEAEYNAMVDEVVKKMMILLEENPTIPNIAFTIEDHQTVCSCEHCTASAKKYNDSNAAAVIKFLNQVSRKVQDNLEQIALENGTKKRDITILFFAYHKMLKPPVTKNSEGKWEPIDDEVRCDEKVAVYLAPIEASYTVSFNDEENSVYKDNVDGWASCADLIYMWTYGTNFGYYLFPYNSYDSMIENYRYFKSLGAVYMWTQGQHMPVDSTHFSRFKDYINSKALFDVNVNLKELTDDYFANCYLDAVEPMRQYYDELQAHLTYLRETNSVELRGYVREEIAKMEYWPSELLTRWMGYIDEAYMSIEKYKTADPELYSTLYDRINLESIFIRFAQISLYAGNYTSDELLSMKLSFKNDCARLGITHESEHVQISNVFAQWGIS